MTHGPLGEPSSILLAHPDGMRRAELLGDLEALGHRVAAQAATAAELTTRARGADVEVIVTAAQFGDGTGTAALLEVARTEPRPAIVITEETERGRLEEALRDHVMGFLVEPIDRSDLGPLIHLVRERFAEFQELREQVADLESALDARKLIERAKGVMMVAMGIDERTAHRSLQKLANDRRAKLVDTARSVLQAHSEETRGDGIGAGGSAAGTTP